MKPEDQIIIVKCPICNIFPEHQAYTYYYQKNKTKGAYETIREYVCPKCNFGKDEDNRGAVNIRQELPVVPCQDEMRKKIDRRIWNKKVKDSELIFKHHIKMGSHE